MNRRRLIFISIAVSILVTMGWFGYGVWHYLYVSVPNAYAVWNTADLINEFMDGHNGAWPQGWEDLRQTYERSNRPNPEHMGDLRDRVEVDWKADPQLLAASPEGTDEHPPFKVIWLRNGSSTHWAGSEPNWLVWRHLRCRVNSRATTKAGNTGG